jgi:hypothetical protein
MTKEALFESVLREGPGRSRPKPDDAPPGPRLAKRAISFLEAVLEKHVKTPTEGVTLKRDSSWSILIESSESESFSKIASILYELVDLGIIKQKPFVSASAFHRSGSAHISLEEVLEYLKEHKDDPFDFKAFRW